MAFVARAGVMCMMFNPDGPYDATEGCSESGRQEGGARLLGLQESSVPGKPLITIIASTYDAAEHLPNAIKSIREQAYGNIEWIVIDGASKDGTLDLLRQSEEVIGLQCRALGNYWAWMAQADVIAVAVMNRVRKERECVVRCLLCVKASIGLHGLVSQ